jgi:hypothetical protein
MSIITWPTTLSTAAEFTLGQQRYDVTESSDSTGADAARLLGPPRWTVSLRSVDAVPLAEAGAWEAMLLQLRGRVNHLALHDPVRAVPQGNLRGSPILNATAAAGARSLVLANVRHADNLLIYQRSFDNAAWTLVLGATVTPDTTASPPGSSSADTITDPNAAASALVRQSVAVADDSTTYVGSVFVRKTSGGTSPTFAIRLTFTGGSAATEIAKFNTDTGSVLSGTMTVESYSGTWWRIYKSLANDASGNTALQFDLFPAIAAYGLSATDVTATGSAIVWSAQLQPGTTPTDYDLADLKAGDWLQIGTGVGTSQLVKVTADAQEVNAGTMTVSFEPPLRAAFSAGTAVTWNRPIAYYKQTSAPQWGYRARMSTGYALDLLESWTA